MVSLRFRGSPSDSALSLVSLSVNWTLRLLTLCTFLLTSGSVRASPWALVEFSGDHDSLELLEHLPLMVEGGERHLLRAELRLADIELVRAAGVEIELLVPDIAALRPDVTQLAWSSLGQWQGYHDVAQVEESLRDLVALYPECARLVEVGRSVYGRSIWGVILSDRPWTRESDEPSMRILGGHHGDEWAAIELPLRFSWFLAEACSAGVEEAAFLERTELWVVPLLNPDGMDLFTRTNANSVDLNRNYSFMWRGGAYSGSGPFSEPETYSIRLLSFVRSFYHSLSMHSGATNLGWVWNHRVEVTPDEEWLSLVAEDYLGMTTDENFWVTNGAQWYRVRGDVNDWSYGVRGGHDYTLELSRSKTPDSDKLSVITEDHFPALLHFLGGSGQAGIRGRVVDSGGKGVEAALSWGVATSESYSEPETGAFHRLGPVGEVQLRAYAPGFKPTTTTVNVGDGVEGVTLVLESDTSRSVRIVGSELLVDEPSELEFCSLDGEEFFPEGMQWSLWRPGFRHEMGGLAGVSQCLRGYWDPALLSNQWEREGEWTVLLSDSEGKVLARVELGVAVVSSIQSVGVRVSLSEPVEIEWGEGENPQNPLWLRLVGAEVPEGAGVRLVNTVGERRWPVWRRDSPGEALAELVFEAESMASGNWSVRIFGGGHWRSLPEALFFREGAWSVAGDLSGDGTTSGGDSSSNLTPETSPGLQADGCGCRSSSPALLWLMLVGAWVSRQRLVTQ